MVQRAEAPLAVRTRPDAGARDLTTGSIAAALLAVSRAMNQVKSHEQLAKRAGVDLDRSGAALLYSLYAEGDNVRLTELADRLGIDAPGVTRKVQQLERARLLARAPDPDDARAMRLTLTAAGRKSIDRLLQARETWIEGALDGWSTADRREFARLLALFASTIVRTGELHDGD
jgi:DNA-binding MarR family transcriptional regulator